MVKTSRGQSVQGAKERAPPSPCFSCPPSLSLPPKPSLSCAPALPLHPSFHPHGGDGGSSRWTGGSWSYSTVLVSWGLKDHPFSLVLQPGPCVHYMYYTALLVYKVHYFVHYRYSAALLVYVVRFRYSTSLQVNGGSSVTTLLQVFYWPDWLDLRTVNHPTDI